MLCISERRAVERNLGQSGNRSGNNDTGQIPGHADHSQSSVLKFLDRHVLLLGVAHLGPVSGPVDSGFLSDFTSERLSVDLGSIFDPLDGAAEDDELGPPLEVGLEKRLDGVCGVYRTVGEVPNSGEAPSDGRQHCRTSVGELGLAEMVQGRPLRQLQGVELRCGTARRKVRSRERGCRVGSIQK